MGEEKQEMHENSLSPWCGAEDGEGVLWWVAEVKRGALSELFLLDDVCRSGFSFCGDSVICFLSFFTC